MWEYQDPIYSDELQHYGVMGMRWGVRRASKVLSSSKSSQGKRDKAISSLEKHKSKTTAKIASLEKKRTKLDDNLRKSTEKDMTKATKLEKKAAKLDQKIAKNQRKAGGMFTSQKKAEKLLSEANVMQAKSTKLHTKAKTLTTKYESAKAKVDANESMQKAFKQGLSSIDKALVEAGKRHLHG